MRLLLSLSFLALLVGCGISPSEQFNLGVAYANGAGVSQDDVLAYAWWNIAQAGDYEYASVRKERASRGMTKEQIAEARELSRELMRKIEANTSD